MKFLSMFLMVLLVPMFAFAQDLALDDFLLQGIEVVKGLGGLSGVLQAAGIIGLLVASMKVSFLRGLLWDKLPQLTKTLAAPALGLLYGLLSMGSDLSLGAAIAYLTVGAGAIVFHELLDGLKTIPGIGDVYVTIINLISAILGGKKS